MFFREKERPPVFADGPKGDGAAAHLRAALHQQPRAPLHAMELQQQPEGDDVPIPVCVGAGDALDWTPPIPSALNPKTLYPSFDYRPLWRMSCTESHAFALLALCGSLKHSRSCHLHPLSWLVAVLANCLQTICKLYVSTCYPIIA